MLLILFCEDLSSKPRCGCSNRFGMGAWEPIITQTVFLWGIYTTKGSSRGLNGQKQGEQRKKTTQCTWVDRRIQSKWTWTFNWVLLQNWMFACSPAGVWVACRRHLSLKTDGQQWTEEEDHHNKFFILPLSNKLSSTISLLFLLFYLRQREPKIENIWVYMFM